MDAVEQQEPFESLHAIVNFLQQAGFSSVEPTALNEAIFRQNSEFHSKKDGCCTMPAPLQVGCHVNARVGLLVEHVKPDGTKANRRQREVIHDWPHCGSQQSYLATCVLRPALLLKQRPTKSKNKRVKTNKPLLNMFKNASNLIRTRLVKVS